MRVTHLAVANLLGVSEATVSRLRAGERAPSWSTRLKIKHALGWKLTDQAMVMYTDNNEERIDVAAWAAGFERAIREFYEAHPEALPAGRDRVVTASTEGGPS